MGKIEKYKYYCGRPKCGKVINMYNLSRVFIQWYEGADYIIDPICDDCLEELKEWWKCL